MVAPRASCRAGVSIPEAFLAAVVREKIAEIKFMIENGADPCHRYSYGMTCLHWAVQRNAVLAIEALLEAGANPDAACDDGSTPLHMACREEDVEAIALLLRYVRNAGLSSVSLRQRSTSSSWMLTAS